MYIQIGYPFLLCTCKVLIEVLVPVVVVVVNGEPFLFIFNLYLPPCATLVRMGNLIS